MAALATLEVKGRAPKTGYSREQFGDGWVDTDHNGCDTRNDVLARDLTGETFKASTRDCVVATGTLADPYGGTTIAFTRRQGTSSAVQIDHVAALSDDAGGPPAGPTRGRGVDDCGEGNAGELEPQTARHEVGTGRRGRRTTDPAAAQRCGARGTGPGAAGV